jgi:hypothetical protein
MVLLKIIAGQLFAPSYCLGAAHFSELLCQKNSGELTEQPK